MTLPKFGEGKRKHYGKRRERFAVGAVFRLNAGEAAELSRWNFCTLNEDEALRRKIKEVLRQIGDILYKMAKKLCEIDSCNYLCLCKLALL